MVMESPVARYLIQSASFSSGQILCQQFSLGLYMQSQICINMCSQKIELSCNNIYRTNQDNFSGLYIEYDKLHIPLSLCLLGEPNIDDHNYVVSLITRGQLPFSCSFCHKKNSVTQYNYKNCMRARGLEHDKAITR